MKTTITHIKRGIRKKELLRKRPRFNKNKFKIFWIISKEDIDEHLTSQKTVEPQSITEKMLSSAVHQIERDIIFDLKKDYNETFGCVDILTFGKIYIFLERIAKVCKTQSSIINKINYVILHELIHGFLKNKDEELVEALTEVLLWVSTDYGYWFKKYVLRVYNLNLDSHVILIE